MANSALRDALKSATALQGATVSPDATPPASITSDASNTNGQPATPNITPTERNEPKPAKRAIEYARAGIERALAGKDMLDNGVQQIAAAIVDWHLNGYKWTPAEAIATGQGNADLQAGLLATFRAGCVKMFIGERPSQSTKGRTIAQIQIAKDEADEYDRRRFHVNNGANLALCLMSDGCTMRDYNAQTGLWSLLAPLFCEEGNAPIDAKKRWTIERCRAAADYIPCQLSGGTKADTQQPRDMAHYVAVACKRHAIITESVEATKRREAKSERTPRTPNGTKPEPTKTDTKTDTKTPPTPTPSMILAPELPTPGSDPQPTPGYDSGKVTTPASDPDVNRKDAPTDIAARMSFEANVSVARKALLAMCDASSAKTWRDVNKNKLASAITPTTIGYDGFTAWCDFVALAVQWHVAHGGTLTSPPKFTKPEPEVAAPVVAPATIVDGVTLSVATKAEPVTPPTPADAPTRKAGKKKTADKAA